MAYEPQEDSYLLLKQVKKHAFGRVLDVGTGSGIQALGAAKLKKVKSVLAVDIDKDVIEQCKKRLNPKKVDFRVSDLFSEVEGKFDTIIFNPPYLPQEESIADLAIFGGKMGYEIIERFINEANGHLTENGIILLLFSSLTKKNKIDKIISDNLVESKLIAKSHIFFEDLFVYKITKKEILKELERKGITNIHYFAKGKRGVVFTGIYRKKKIAVKIKREESKAVGRIQNEAYWLKKLSRYHICPKYLFSNKNFLVCEFADGNFILDYIEHAPKQEAIKIIKRCFDIGFLLDKLKIDKREMHHPVRHIIISNSKVVFIDFERARHSKKPKNVTQFVQFTLSRANGILLKMGIKINKKRIIGLAKSYKRNQTKENFEKLRGAIR